MPSIALSEEDACRILEINIGSSEAEIKSAYKKLALRTHPDKNPNDASANKRFLAVSEAYKRLTEEEFSDDDDYDDYDEDDEDFDISEIFAFRMFERMFFEAASGGQSRRGAQPGSNGENTRNTAQTNGGVQFSFPSMGGGGGGGGCNCPDCRRRFGYEKTKPWREYVPKSQRTDIPKETVKEVDPSIHDNWLSDEEDVGGGNAKGNSKLKSKKAQKRENAAKEQKAQIDRQERQAKSKDQHHHHQHHSHHHHHEASAEETHMHMNKVNKLKHKQEEERVKLEQEKAKKNTSKKKGKQDIPVTTATTSTKKQKDKDKSKSKHKVEHDSDDDEDDDSDLDFEEMASRLGITDTNNSTKNTTKSATKSSATVPSHSTVTAAVFTTTAANTTHKYKAQIAMLQEMGFEYGPCLNAIETSFGSVELAATMLLQSDNPDEPPPPVVVKKTNVMSINASTKRAPTVPPTVPPPPPNTTVAPGLSTKKPHSTTNYTKNTPSVATSTPTTQHKTAPTLKQPPQQPLAMKKTPIPIHNSTLNHSPSYLNASTGAAGINRAGNISNTGMPQSRIQSQGQKQGIPVATHSPPQLPPGFMGQSQKQMSQQQQQLNQQQLNQQQQQKQQQQQQQAHSSIFAPSADNLSAMGNMMPGGLSMPDNSRMSLKNNTPNFEFFNHQQSSTSPNSQSSPASMPNQAMPMPAQHHQQPQQQQQQHQQTVGPSSSSSSSKFFSLFAPHDNDLSANQHEALGSSYDYLLNDDSHATNNINLMNNDNNGLEYPSIFDNIIHGHDEDTGGGGGSSGGMNMSRFGLDMTGLGGENSSSASLSSMLGEQGHESQGLQHHSSECDVLGSLLGDMSLDMLGGSSFLLDSDPILPDAYSTSPQSTQHNQASLHMNHTGSTAASIVKHGKANRTSPNSSTFAASPPRSSLKSSQSAPTSPGNGSKCLYFTTSRGCRHGANCKFIHQTAIPAISMTENNNNGTQKTLYQPNIRGSNVSVGVSTLTPSKKTCMFFSTPQGCKHGSLCRFVHSHKLK